MATTRGPTRRWSLNYPKIFQEKCIQCGRILKSGEIIICDSCRKKKRSF